jgi:hypothetical protein
MQKYAEKSASVNYLKCAKYCMVENKINLVLAVAVFPSSQQVLDTVSGRAKSSIQFCWPSFQKTIPLKRRILTSVLTFLFPEGRHTFFANITLKLQTVNLATINRHYFVSLLLQIMWKILRFQLVSRYCSFWDPEFRKRPSCFLWDVSRDSSSDNFLHCFRVFMLSGMFMTIFFERTLDQ